jgi:hypothetical protein
MTSSISWLNGISALAATCFCFIYAIYFVHLYRKTKNKLYLNGTILGLAIAFGNMGIALSFLSVLIYGYNVSGIKLGVNILSFITIPIGAMAVLSIAWEMLMPPKYKKHMLIAVGIFSIFFYIVFFMTFNRAVICPDVPNGEIYDNWLSSEELPYYLIYIFVLGNTIIFAIGILRFFKAVTGELRKRAIWILIATPIIGTCIALETVVFTSIIYVNLLYIPRFLLIPGLSLTIKGFKP